MLEYSQRAPFLRDFVARTLTKKSIYVHICTITTIKHSKKEARGRKEGIRLTLKEYNVYKAFPVKILSFMMFSSVLDLSISVPVNTHIQNKAFCSQFSSSFLCVFYLHLTENKMQKKALIFVKKGPLRTFCQKLGIFEEVE